MRNSKNPPVFGILLGIMVLMGAMIPSTGQAQGTNIIVTTKNDVINPGDGLCSLREAILSANNNPGIVPPGECAGGSDTETDVIVLEEDSIYNLSIPGTGEDSALTGDLDILDNTAAVDIRIVVDVADASAIDAADLDRVFHLHGASLELFDVNLREGEVANNGGVILNEGGSLYMEDSFVLFGTATSGGGIFNNDGQVTLIDSVLSFNKSSLNGGALMSVGPNATVLIDSSILTFNESTGGSGGAVSANDGTIVMQNSSYVGENMANANGGGINLTGAAVLTVSESTLIDNSATFGSGGAVFSTALDPGNKIQVFSSTFTDNVAAGAGGAISSVSMDVATFATDFYGNAANGNGGAISAGDVRIDGGVFDWNTAAGSGGAIKGSIVVLDDAAFSNNISEMDGGAVYVSDGFVTGCSFIENHADIGFGGAIFQTGSGRIDVTDVQFRGNTALAGGGIYAFRAFAHDSSFIGNSGPVSGGAIFGEALVQATGSSFLLNSAGFNGGAIYQEGNLVSPDHFVHSSTFAYNMAGNDGGAIWAGSLQGLTIANTTISNNEADLGAGLFVDASVTVDLINVTLADNTASSFGGGFYMVGDVNVQNTILAGNGPQNCVSSGNLVTSLGNNIASDGTCDLNLGSDLENTDPQLDILTDNGGPTLTHALLPGSPAIDSADAAACAAAHVNGIDQRGVWRPVGTGCDIGAFEFGQVLFLPIVIRD